MGNNRVIKNASWIIVCRVVQALLSFVISMMTARCLGPSNFGLINYAASIVAFVVPIMKLGFDSILVQEIIINPEIEGEILGTSFVLNMVSGLMCMVGVVSFCAVANSGETETIIVCALYSLMILAQAAGMMQFWFQAKLLSKYTSIISLISYLIVSAYKVFLLMSGKEIYWFAVSNALDYFLIAVALYAIYMHMGNKKLTYSMDMAKKMLSKSKYYIVSGLMITIFSQTDRIMLKMMIGEAEVGYYSSAVACAGVTSFVFSALIDSMRPVIFEGKNIGKDVYEYRVRQLYSIVVYSALVQSVVITAFSDLIIYIIYGVQYMSAVPGLRIIVWYTTFSYYGGAKDVWILAEGKHQYLIWLNLSGAIANVILNYFLIPIWGISGAATASLVTQFFTNIVMGFVIKPLRYNNYLLFQSLNPKILKDIGVSLLNLICRKIKR